MFTTNDALQGGRYRRAQKHSTEQDESTEKRRNTQQSKTKVQKRAGTLSKAKQKYRRTQKHSAKQKHRRAPHNSAAQSNSTEVHLMTKLRNAKTPKRAGNVSSIMFFSEFQCFARSPIFLNSVEQSDSVVRDHFSALVHPTSVRAGVMKLLTQHPPAVGFAPADFFSREKISRVANFPRRMFSGCERYSVVRSFLTPQIFLRRGNGGDGVTRSRRPPAA